MQNWAGRGITPQAKNINVNDKFGNKGIKQMQGSTIIKYDSLPLDGRSEYRFFEGSSARLFPYTNCSTDGNKLGVGNSLVVERVYLSIFEVKETGGINLVEQFTLAGTDANLLVSELSFSIANSDVIKQLPVLSFLPEFNKNSENELSTSFDFDTQVVIPPLLEYVATLRLPIGVTEPGKFLRLTIEGSGAIIAPRTTF
jgi:hypothetical protein